VEETGPIQGASDVVSRSRMWSLSPRDRRALTRVVGAFLLTRLILYVTGAVAIRMVPPDSGPRVEAFLGRNPSLVGWVRWDAAWYLSVAERGYWFDPHGASNVAFFPLLPLLIKGVATLTGNLVIAGLLVANLAALGAVLALWRWVRAEAGPAAAERAVLWLLVYPFSFFLHSIYAESLFFLLATLALDASARGQRLAAGLWGGLAATTRPMGVLLTPALAWGLWRDWRGGRHLCLRDAIAVFLPAAGLGAYAAYLWVAFGDPLAFWTAHVVGWHVEFQTTVTKYWRETYWVVTRLVRVHTYTHLLDAMRILLPVVFVALTVQVFRRLGAVPGIYTSLAVTVAVFFALTSVGREFLAVTPAFAATGLTGPRGTLGEALRSFSLGLLVLFLFAFITGRFVG
jgi:Gpi18-like mannosyltransferase